MVLHFHASLQSTSKIIHKINKISPEFLNSQSNVLPKEPGPAREGRRTIPAKDFCKKYLILLELLHIPPIDDDNEKDATNV